MSVFLSGLSVSKITMHGSLGSLIVYCRECLFSFASPNESAFAATATQHGKILQSSFQSGVGEKSKKSVGRLVTEAIERFWGDALAVDEIDDFHALCHEVGAIHGLLLQQRFQAQL